MSESASQLPARSRGELPSGPVSQAEREHYQEHGYFVVPGLFEPSELESWKERLLAITSGEVEPPKEMLIMRDVMVAKGAVTARTRAEGIAKIQDLHTDPVFFETYMKSPKILDRIEWITGPDIKSIHSMLINKPPGVDGRHPLHQDLLYFPFRPADAIVASWTALEPCTRENGCLVVVPGSHKGELLEHASPDWEWLNLAYFGAKSVDAGTQRQHLEMEPGDTVFFHPILLHGSGRNRTNGFRRAISAHYAGATCEFLPGANAVGKIRPYLSVRGREHSGCI